MSRSIPFASEFLRKAVLRTGYKASEKRAGADAKILRVLCDLSPCTLGFSGIPRDTRVNFRLLGSQEEIQPIGLLYHPNSGTLTHRFDSDDGNRLDIQANHARYFASLTSGVPEGRFEKLRGVLGGAVGVMMDSVARAEPASRQTFDELIWRTLLGKSLPPSDRAWAAEQEYILSSLSTHQLLMRRYLHLPATLLPTPDIDVLLLPEPRIMRASPNTLMVTRFHDAIPLRAPDLIGSAHRYVNNFALALAHAAENSHFVCNSKPSEDELLNIHPELEGRTAVVPCAIPDGFSPTPNPQMVESILRQRSVSGGDLHDDMCQGQSSRELPLMHIVGQEMRYVMTTSNIEPKKNHLALLRSFERVEARHPGRIKLVVVGELGWDTDAVCRVLRPLMMAGKAIRLAKVPLQELKILMSSASLFVFPSFCEGFGLPPAEAVACGAPVLVSDIPAHRWVLQDGAAYCDPYNVSDMASQMEQLLFHTERGALDALIARGQRAIARFRPDVLAPQWKEILLSWSGDPARRKPLKASKKTSYGKVLKRPTGKAAQATNTSEMRNKDATEKSSASACAA